MALLDLLKDGLNMSANSTQKKDPKGFDDKTKKNIAMVAIPAILWAVHKAVREEDKKKELEKIGSNNKKLDTKDMTTSIEAADPKEGRDILDQILGKNKAVVSKEIAEKAHVSQEEVDAVLEKITPTIIEMLQKEKDEKGVSYGKQVRDELSQMQNDSTIGNASTVAKENIEDEKEIPFMDGVLDILGKFIK